MLDTCVVELTSYVAKLTMSVRNSLLGKVGVAVKGNAVVWDRSLRECETEPGFVSIPFTTEEDR